jgi:hypothetical protein
MKDLMDSKNTPISYQTKGSSKKDGQQNWKVNLLHFLSSMLQPEVQKLKDRPEYRQVATSQARDRCGSLPSGHKASTSHTQISLRS